MLLKISFAIAFIASFIIGIATCCKFYNYISSTELILLIFVRVIITFILFCGLVIGIYFFLKQQVPQLFHKSKVKKIDYVLPSVSPTTEVEKPTISESKPEKKKTHIEELTKAEPEKLAMLIRTTMTQE